MTAFLTRAGTPIIIATAFLAAAALLAYLALATVRSMIDGAAVNARELEAAEWRTQIEQVEAEVARKAQAQAHNALAIEADANARVREAEQKLADMEKENAALPDGDACGLDLPRVRLLAR